MTNIELVKHLKEVGVLKSENITKAIEEVERVNFVGKENEDYAYYDDALPIGYGQTISQPLTVVFMLELLEPKEGNVIMDVGSGSGWQSCLLAHLVGEKGFIYALELVPELYKSAENNSSIYPKLKESIKFYNQNAKDGLPEEAKSTGGFDRIICAADVKEVPQSWLNQLKVGGIMVYPKDSGIFKEIKTSEERFEKQFHPGFSFVPFIEN